MAEYGLLIDYEYCTGCKTCTMACQVEKDLPQGRDGIVVKEVGPWQIEGDTWQYDYIPVPTDECDLCAERVAAGKKPSCVAHCLADVMRYGTIEELAVEMTRKPKQLLFVLK